MKSITGGHDIKFTTYLAELVMVRKYEKGRKKLPPKFWNLPEYKEEFQKQLIKAVSLSKIFDEQALLAVLKREKWIFSLYVKRLPNMIKVEERKVKKIKEVSKNNKDTVLKERKIDKVNQSNGLFSDLDD